MRELDLQACQPRPWRHSLTENDGSAGPIPDLVNRDFTADAPGRKMVGDITYIPTWEGWIFLATVIDCTSTQFANTLTGLRIRQSVGRTGICYDNAMAESFFATLKNERVHRTVYPTREHAYRDIARYIEVRYNTKRRHSGLGYRTPREVHDEYLNQQLAA
ncbi:integrase core domain-containing protein [Streptomyces sp. NBC_01264]|uniref:integrase core domain-containing protein n=1 Tax=Streptomyces sp. NBC_01264 TaxID=2903804 RepID=UPI003D2FECDA